MIIIINKNINLYFIQKGSKWTFCEHASGKGLNQKFQPLLQFTHLGPAIQQIGAEEWPVVDVCTTLAGHIAGWCGTVNTRSCLEWVYVYYCDILYSMSVGYGEGRVKDKPGANFSLLFSKSPREPPEFTSRRTNHYQQYICLHIIFAPEGYMDTY